MALLLIGGAAVLLPLAASAGDSLDPVLQSLPGGGSVRIVKCYPQGKMRASCQSFDDGTLGSDWPVLDALRQRGIPATFFLNSLHPQSQDALKFPQRYAGFEIASHGANHKGLAGMSDEQVRGEIESDQRVLGQAFGQVIDGFAYPYGAVPKEEAELVKLENQLRGFKLLYARGVGVTRDFAPPADFIRWQPNCGLLDRMDKFLAVPADDTVRVRMCFTHSIDFARGQVSFAAWLHQLDQLQADPTIWSATLRDCARYVVALRALDVTGAGLQNNTPTAVWLRVDGKLREIPAHASVTWAALRS